jgi:hypothetical protein
MNSGDYTLKLIEVLKNKVASLMVANAELEAALLSYQEEATKTKINAFDEKDTNV